MSKAKRLVPPDRLRPPRLIQVLGLSLLLGAAVGVAFISLLLLSNIAGLKDLIARSHEPYLAIFLLYFFNALTFASVTMGATIMALPWDREPSDD